MPPRQNEGAGTRFRLGWLIAFLLVLLAGAGVGLLSISPWGVQLSVVSGFKAKTLCAGLFLQGLDQKRLEAEDVGFNSLAPWFPAWVDRDRQTVFCSLWGTGLFAAEAVRVPGLGVVLLAGRPEAEVRAFGTQIRPNAAAALEWPAAPATATMDRALDWLFAEKDPAHPLRTRAVVVVHGGKIVGERYADGIDADTPLISFSMAKSVTALLTGIVVGQGKLDVRRPAPVPQWSAPNDGRSAITTEHLLQMRSGLAWREVYNTDLTSDVDRMLFAEPDHSAYAADKPLASTPGTTFNYSSGNSDLVSRVLRTAVGNDGDYWNLPYQELFGPLGAKTAEWAVDASGTFIGAASIYASARDWARVGQLCLQDGVWQGKRLLPEGWIKFFTTSNPADQGGHYGASVALNGKGGKIFPNMPGDVYYFAGYNGQFVFVCPSLDVVVVRLGMTWEDAGDMHWTEFFTVLRKALRELPS